MYNSCLLFESFNDSIRLKVERCCSCSASYCSTWIRFSLPWVRFDLEWVPLRNISKSNPFFLKTLLTYNALISPHFSLNRLFIIAYSRKASVLFTTKGPTAWNRPRDFLLSECNARSSRQTISISVSIWWSWYLFVFL